jgi:hypothetical protein
MKKKLISIGILLTILSLASCAKGTVQYTEEIPVASLMTVKVEDAPKPTYTLESIPTHTMSTTETPVLEGSNMAVVPEICEGSGPGICGIPNFIEREFFYVEAIYSGAGDFVVWVVDSQENQLALIFEETGDYQGTKLFPLFWLGEDIVDQDVANLMVEQGIGTWTIEVNSVNNAFSDLIRDLNQQVNGTGDDVMLTYGTTAQCRFICDAPGDFIVRTINTESEVNLLIDETGPYTGTFLVPDVIIIEITCPGNWSISPDK